MNLLAKAIRIASTSFEDIIDKSGKPYILHCLWVMNKVRHLGEDYMIVAVLHDLIEDTEWNSFDLIEEGFPEYIVKSLMLLDFNTSNDYIQRIVYINELASSNILIGKIAREIKLRDLEHNSKITRLKGIESNDIRRMKKYHRAYLILKSHL